MKEINLTVTVEEANQILDALSQRPFKDVFALIGKIQNQAAAQFQKDQPVSFAEQEGQGALTILDEAENS